MKATVKEIPRKENCKSRQAARRKAYLEKREADRALARDISKAWGRLTKPIDSLAEFRHQIQTAADLAARAQLNGSFRRFLNRISFRS